MEIVVAMTTMPAYSVVSAMERAVEASKGKQKKGEVQ